MKERLVLIFVMTLLSFTVPPLSFPSDFYVDGIGYNVLSREDKTCYVDEMSEYKENLIIPASVTYNNNTLTVKEIGYHAFLNNQAIKSVIVSEGITSVRRGAFAQSSLKEIRLPRSLTTIEEEAFRSCNISTIEIPDSIKVLDWATFMNCQYLTSVSLPQNLQAIDEGVFYDCRSLTSINIPERIKILQGELFKNCTSLSAVTLPSSVSTIKDRVFENCNSLENISLPSNLTNIGYSAFKDCTSLQQIEIPDSVKEIGHSLFLNCSTLSSIKLSSNLARIPYGAFYGCSSLRQLIIPGSITEMELFDAIYYSSYISDIKPQTNSLTFGGCKDLSLIFENGTLLEMGINFPLPTRYKYAQYMYSDWDVFNSASSMYIGRNISTSIYAPNLKELIIGENTTFIKMGYATTYDYYENLPRSLISIVSFNPIPPKISPTTQGQYLDIIVKVPYEALEAYKNADVWKNFWNIEGFDPAGVDDVTTNILNSSSSCQEISRYNLNGEPVSEDYEGVVIVRFSDGRSKKIMQ